MSVKVKSFPSAWWWQIPWTSELLHNCVVLVSVGPTLQFDGRERFSRLGCTAKSTPIIGGPAPPPCLWLRIRVTDKHDQRRWPPGWGQSRHWFLPRCYRSIAFQPPSRLSWDYLTDRILSVVLSLRRPRWELGAQPIQEVEKQFLREILGVEIFFVWVKDFSLTQFVVISILRWIKVGNRHHRQSIVLIDHTFLLRYSFYVYCFWPLDWTSLQRFHSCSI